ncbi:uncharacterized protein LOC141762887 isoform X4 [Sebastes fasciatus]|uniref:uncharacterized protein LOC141762887 isoform X4 n=1 Tax=Sebastes fasciatus TaxID=394691 RepID=UPI003D9F7381
MNIHIVLFFCFLTGALCDGTTGTSRCINATEGGNIRVQCSLLSVRNVRKFFCENDCRGDDVLVVTSGSGAQNGRFSLEVDSQRLYVNIAQLVKSDSGRYRCGVRRGRPRFTASYDFDLCVTDGEFHGNLRQLSLKQTRCLQLRQLSLKQTRCLQVWSWCRSGYLWWWFCWLLFCSSSTKRGRSGLMVPTRQETQTAPRLR